MKSAVGISHASSAVRAAVEAGRGVIDGLDGGTPDWALVFLTADHGEHLAAIAGTLESLFETDAIVGCTATGVLTGRGECEEGSSVAILGVRAPTLDLRPFLVDDEGDHGRSAGIRIGERLDTADAGRRLILVWPDAYHVRPDHLLHGLDAVLGPVPVVGGASSSWPSDLPRRQFCGARNSEASVAGACLDGRFRHRVAVFQGCRALTPPLEVTRGHDRLVLELDGRPALDVLHDAVDGGRLDGRVFVGRVPDAGSGPRDFLVRNITEADPDTGVIAINDRVDDGQRLVFVERSAEAARRDLDRELERLHASLDGMEPAFGLYFNCVARGRALYGERDVDVAAIRRRFPDLPLLGFFCNAEIGPIRGENHLFTYTGVLLLVGEGAGKTVPSRQGSD